MDDEQELIHDDRHVNSHPFYSEYTVSFPFLTGIHTTPSRSIATENLSWQLASQIQSEEIPSQFKRALQQSDLVSDLSSVVSLERDCDAAVRGNGDSAQWSG